MGCDGLFDFMDNQEIINFIIFQIKQLGKIQNQIDTQNRMNIAKLLANYVYNAKKGTDNVSILIIFL